MGEIARLFGWISGEWHKNAFALDYSATKAQDFSDTSLTAGNPFLYGPIVPEGELWVIQNLDFFYTGTPPTSIELQAIVADVIISLKLVNPPVSSQRYQVATTIVLAQDDRVSLAIIGATAGNAAGFRWCGYRVDIDK